MKRVDINKLKETYEFASDGIEVEPMLLKIWEETGKPDCRLEKWIIEHYDKMKNPFFRHKFSLEERKFAKKVLSKLKNRKSK